MLCCTCSVIFYNIYSTIKHKIYPQVHPSPSPQGEASGCAPGIKAARERTGCCEKCGMRFALESTGCLENCRVRAAGERTGCAENCITLSLPILVGWLLSEQWTCERLIQSINSDGNLWTINTAVWGVAQLRKEKLTSQVVLKRFFLYYQPLSFSKPTPRAVGCDCSGQPLCWPKWANQHSAVPLFQMQQACQQSPFRQSWGGPSRTLVSRAEQSRSVVKCFMAPESNMACA